MNDSVIYGIEIAVGLILIPYFTWVTLSIFNLRQQLAVMKAELGILEDIKIFIKGLNRND